MRKAFLALMELPVWYRGVGSICNCNLGALRRESRESWGGFLEEEPFSQGFGEWEEVEAGKRKSEMILIFFF